MPKHMTHRYAKGTGEREETVGDYMTVAVLSVDSKTPVREVAAFMQEKQVGSLLVMRGGEYTGIVTERDLTRKVVSLGLNVDTTSVEEIMTCPILSMESTETVVDANKFMARNHIRHLGVTKNGKIAGILSVRDLVHFYSNPRLRQQ